MKHKVLLTQRFNDAQLGRLAAVSPDLEIVQRSVSEAWDRMDTGSLMTGDEEILYGFMPPRDLTRAPKLRWVQLHSAGINQLEGHPILRSNILITTSSGIHAVPIGGFAIALMLALARRIPQIVQAQERGEWPHDRWRTFVGPEVHGMTLGIVGYGSIGRETARIAKQGFQMRILALTRSGNRVDNGYHEPGVGDPTGILPDAWFGRDQLFDLLAESDFVLIAAPLTPETRNLIDARALEAMKPTAYIVNIARGGIIDETALAHALEENRIAGAGLDVFAQEPLPSDSPLWKVNPARLIMTPHISAATPHYDDRAVELFATNLRRYLRGETLFNLVNKELAY